MLIFVYLTLVRAAEKLSDVFGDEKYHYDLVSCSHSNTTQNARRPRTLLIMKCIIHHHHYHRRRH